jgi:conjugative relaxase-like TrwC/TraI family protein
MPHRHYGWLLMVRVCQCKCGKAARNYYTKADYYLDRQELAGRWGGSACRLLNLPEGEEVSKQPFDLLTDNRHPLTGEKLTVRQKDKRTSGYDINFHCSKSVSILYSLTSDPDILGAFQWAVGQTMRAMEAHMKTRVRTDGQCFDRLVGNMAWATFIHLTARPVLGIPDPHLHAHCFCFNAVFDPVEDRWKAGQFREIKQQAPQFQALFRNLFAGRLSQRGYSVVWKGDDFEIEGFSPALIQKFSRRTQLIESEAARLGIVSDTLKDSLGAKTREKKQPDATMTDLRRVWWLRLTDGERDEVARAELHKRRPWPGDRRRHGHDDPPVIDRQGDDTHDEWQGQRIAAHERDHAEFDRNRRAAGPRAAPATRWAGSIGDGRRARPQPLAARMAPPTSPPQQRSNGYGR